MRKHAVVALKPGVENEELLELTRSVLEPGGRMHLVSYVQISTNENEVQRLAETQEHIDQIADKVRGEGYEVETEVQVAGVGIGTNLARVATRVEADILVIGLTKRSRVGKALLGSDAQSTLMHATCPVLCSRLS